MPTVTINNQPVEIGASEKLNCVQAAQRAGVEIPHYCWHPELSVVASCRMCLVEVGDTKPDGTVAMQPKLLPGCQTPVKDGTVIISDSPKVKAAQAATLEYLLLNHPLDCPVCDQAGECFLQDYSFKFGRGFSRLQEPKTLKPDKDYIGDQITLFTDRCVMCTRCVRFTREYSGTSELQVINRGTHGEIDIFPGEPCNNKLAGNVVDICPVGALCSKDFLYEQRVWWLQTKNSVCPGCSTGCSIKVDQNRDVLYRLKPRDNPQAQGPFMCDDGRFGWKYQQSDQRLTHALQRQGGQISASGWSVVMPLVRQTLQESVKINPYGVAAVFSPWMTVEEAWLLAKWLKEQSPHAKLALGPVRIDGVDDVYPKSVAGVPASKARFTIHAEKCPNRLGVELVLKHFQPETVSLAQLRNETSSGKLDAVYLVGGDPTPSFDVDSLDAFRQVKHLIVQDILASPLSEAAEFVLPGGVWAEREGTFVNYNGLAQAIYRALRGPGDSMPDGRILWDLAQRKGLFHAANLRKEIGSEASSLAALQRGDLGELGVKLSEGAAGGQVSSTQSQLAAAGA